MPWNSNCPAADEGPRGSREDGSPTLYWERMRPERRRYPRVRPELGTVVTCYGAEFEKLPTGRTNLAVKAVDLGGKGACLVTIGRLREGLPVIVEISLPESHARLRARAVVRWSQTWVRESREAHVAGVEFLEILEASGEKVQFMTQGCRRPPTAPTGPALRKEHQKALIQKTQVRYHPIGFWSAMGFRRVRRARLEEIGPDGFRLDCTEKWSPGRRLEVRLDFPSPPLSVLAKAEVLSCRRNTLVLEPHYQIELAIRDITPEDRDRLQEILRILAPP